MVLRLYGYINSTHTKRVAVILHEKKVPFHFTNVDLVKREQKVEEYKAKQPFGQVPYIDDEGFILYESRAICRYLEEKYPNQGAKLVPTDLQKRALFEQAASNEQSNFDTIAAPAVYEALITKRYGGQTNQAKVDEFVVRLNQKLDVYEQILSKQKYLAGDEVTLADLFHLPYASLLPAAKITSIQDRTHVDRWYNDLASRASWEAVKDGVKGTV